MWNSEIFSLGTGCSALYGWSLGSFDGSFIGSRPGVNTGFRDRNLVGMVLEGIDVKSLVSSDGVRSREELVMVSSKRWEIRVMV